MDKFTHDYGQIYTQPWTNLHMAMDKFTQN